jgi:hypothetical protein
MAGAERNYLDLFPPGRSVVTDAASTGGGFHPAIAWTHKRALALSVIPGNRRRSSMTADNSPSCSKVARMAAASASGTRNISRDCRTASPLASHITRSQRYPHSRKSCLLSGTDFRIRNAQSHQWPRFDPQVLNSALLYMITLPETAPTLRRHPRECLRTAQVWFANSSS